MRPRVTLPRAQSQRCFTCVWFPSQLAEAGAPCDPAASAVAATVLGEGQEAFPKGLIEKRLLFLLKI